MSREQSGSERGPLRVRVLGLWFEGLSLAIAERANACVHAHCHTRRFTSQYPFRVLHQYDCTQERVTHVHNYAAVRRRLEQHRGALTGSSTPATETFGMVTLCCEWQASAHKHVVCAGRQCRGESERFGTVVPTHERSSMAARGLERNPALARASREPGRTLVARGSSQSPLGRGNESENHTTFWVNLGQLGCCACTGFSRTTSALDCTPSVCSYP
jgi:hypothetical protein